MTQPFFFEERDSIPVPVSWSPNIVSFKTYNTGDAEGLALWDTVKERLGYRWCLAWPRRRRASASRISFVLASDRVHSAC